MPFGPFILQWRAPSPNPPLPTPLPTGISRTYVSTPSGPLELLSALPPPGSDSHKPKPALFFAHGGFGCAEVWLSFLEYFSARGYPCYALSYRGHGKSWYPGFWRMFLTPRGALAGDLAAGVRHVEGAEKARRRRGAGRASNEEKEEEEEEEEEEVRVVLIAHSNGGALAQYALSRGLIRVWGFCMCAAVPGFGSWPVYAHWAPSMPLQIPYRLFHPRYILATTAQVHSAFFTRATPRPLVAALERLLSPYESMLWPLQGLFAFVTGADVLLGIRGWRLSTASQGISSPSSPSLQVTSRLFVLAAEEDVLCTPGILYDAAQRYRAAFREMVRQGKLDGVGSGGGEKLADGGEEGVRFRVVKGVAHHLQNHVEWERGAAEILEWVEAL